MKIHTVKKLGDGYLLNGSIQVPPSNGNTEYSLIREWIEKGNTPEAEFTEEQLHKKSIEDKINELTDFLNSTQFKFGDDYDLKGTEEWLELKAKRQLARDFIRANK